MKITAICLIWSLISAIAIAAEPVKNLSVDSMQVLKISGYDQRAVVKTPEGRMAVLKAGDVLWSADKTQSLRIIEITSGRIVLEEKKNDEVEKVIIRMTDGKQTLERIKRTRVEPLLTLAPATANIISGQSRTGAKPR